MKRLILLALLLFGCGDILGENGFATVCWSGGSADYIGTCQELKWGRSRIPLTVWLDVNDNIKDSVKKGYTLWNDEVGTLFKFVDSTAVPPPVVHVRHGSSTGTDADGSVHHYGSSSTGPTSAVHSVISPGDLFSIFKVSAHEAGHVLGLDHDRSGLMAPVISTEFGIVLPSDSDATLLADEYL